MSAEADTVIGAGDFASVHEGLEETIGALRAIVTPTVLVPGNNETEEALREAAAAWDAATVLHGSGAEIAGAQFFGLGAGVPVTPWDWSFDLDDEAAAEGLPPAPKAPSSSCTRHPRATAKNGAGMHFGQGAAGGDRAEAAPPRGLRPRP